MCRVLRDTSKVEARLAVSASKRMRRRRESRGRNGETKGASTPRRRRRRQKHSSFANKSASWTLASKSTPLTSVTNPSGEPANFSPARAHQLLTFGEHAPLIREPASCSPAARPWHFIPSGTVSQTPAVRRRFSGPISARPYRPAGKSYLFLLGKVLLWFRPSPTTLCRIAVPVCSRPPRSRWAGSPMY